MNACPPREQLVQLLAEQLGEEAAGPVESHLETCRRCQHLLAELSGPADRCPDALPAPPTPTPEPRPEFLRRLKQVVPTPADAFRTLPVRAVSAAEAGAAPSGKPPQVAGYEILAELGRGGLAVVYQARHVALGRVVALKMIRAGAQASANDRTRFHAEAEAVARLQHPNIVQIFEVGEHEGCPYLALEYVDGGSLAQHVRGVPLPVRTAAGLARTLAQGVHHAHEHGIIHRDLKPANILVSFSRGSQNCAGGDPALARFCEPRLNEIVPKITDFGLAKWLDADQGQTQTGAILGTPSYMAPEQAAGRGRQVGPAADVYALGAILYELLTGRPPFQGESMADTLQQVQFGEPVPPGRLQPRVPRDLETACLKCLEKEPKKRYASAQDLADDLGRFLTGEPIRARRTPMHERWARWAARNRSVAILSTVTVLLLLGVAVVSLVSAVRLGQERNAVLAEQKRANDAERDILANQVEALLTAAPDSVPFILESLRVHQADVRPSLTERLRRSQRNRVERLRLNVALAALGEDRAGDLCALFAETPPAESFSLIRGLKYCERQKVVGMLDSLYRESKTDTGRCRLSIALLELGDPRTAQAELALKANPSGRVHFIHAFSSWHGDLAGALESLRVVTDPSFRSGLCLALGGVDPARLPSDTRRALDTVLAELYTSAPDGGTHSAAGWALRRRGSPVPKLPRTGGPLPERQWFVNRQGMTLIRVEPGLFHPKDYEHPASWDGPLQTVLLPHPFFLLDEAVTAEWFGRFLDSADHPEGERLTQVIPRAAPGQVVPNWDWHKPILNQSVANVDWQSAIRFCNWLSRAEGRTSCYRPDASGRLGLTCDFRANGYRLPTDAELEYVIRAGTTTRYVTGDDVTRMLDYGRVFASDPGPGKMFYPSPWGFFDVIGNWWQMTWDAGYFEDMPRLAIRPVGAVGRGYAIRGGSFDAGPWHLYASQHYIPSNDLDGGCLFRVVCGPVEAETQADDRTAALSLLSRILDRCPGSRPQLWQERGRLYAERGEYEKAATDYARALELAPHSVWIASDVAVRENLFPRVAALQPRNAHLWFLRGDWLARPGRWRDAAAACARAVELNPADPWYWYGDAILRLHTGDRDGYRRDCREMLRRFHDTTSHLAADYTAKTCLLLPDAVADRKPVLKLARRPLAGTERQLAHRWFLLCLALAEYRDGRCDAAVTVIDRTTPKADGGAFDATAYVILALAEERRGRSAAARQALARAQAVRLKKWLRGIRGGFADAEWGDWLRFEVLCREAETRIGGKQ